MRTFLVTSGNFAHDLCVLWLTLLSVWARKHCTLILHDFFLMIIECSAFSERGLYRKCGWRRGRVALPAWNSRRALQTTDVVNVPRVQRIKCYQNPRRLR